METNQEKIVVGIDLGTTNTLATYMKGGKITYFTFGGSNKMLPSVLYVEENGDIIIGEKAKKKGISDPENCIKSSKTYIGGADEKTWECRGKRFTPTNVATEILKEVRRVILKKMKRDETTPIEAVITIPAYFLDRQTEETRQAGINAGFKVMRIVTEPMAAAVAALQEHKNQKKLLVVDLGGGTFDLSVMTKNDKGYCAVSTGGDNHLGGDDFDRIVFERLLEILRDDGIDFSSLEASGLPFNDYYSAYGRLKEAAERAKIDLTEETSVPVSLGNLYSDHGKMRNFECEISRDDFNDLCSPLHKRIMEEIERFVRDGETNKKFTTDEIETIVLAGGGCYIPRVQTEIEDYFKKPVNSELDRSLLVVQGAGLIADSLSGISGSSKEVYQDILSHSLGIKSYSYDGNEIFSKLLDRGTKYPCAGTEVFTTTRDSQSVITVEVYEAVSNEENGSPLDRNAHKFYGSFAMDGIESAPKGVPQIQITFSYDESRCLTVTAEDKKTHARKEVRIEKNMNIQNQSSVAPIDFMLLIDTSSSMESGSGMAEAKRASCALVRDMIDFRVHSMGLISFSSNANRCSPLTQDKDVLLNAINTMQASGATDLFSALRLAGKDLKDSKKDRVVIIVTDGRPNDEPTSIAEAEKLQKEGVRIIAIGAGSGINTFFLEKIANPNDAYHIEGMYKLTETFREVVYGLAKK